jgi:phosphatidate cytidylyltransferase
MEEKDREKNGVDPDEAPQGTPSFSRPWERPSEESATSTETPSGIPTDETPGPPTISEEIYLAATTHEYRGLAQDISASEGGTVKRQAVSAAMRGVGTGLVGFEDVTGRRGVSEEDIEHLEQARASDLTLRVGSALVLVALFLGTLFMGGWWFTLFVTAVMVGAVGEFYATLRRSGYSPLALVGLAGVGFAGVTSHLTGEPAVTGVVVVAAIATFISYSLANRRRPLDNASLTLLGLAWTALLSFAIPIGRSPDAVPVILMVVALVALFDIGSYFIGRGFGRRRLAPVLSPKKTVEGMIGGIVLAVGASSVLSTIDYFPVDLGHALVIALIVVSLSSLGDAAESMVKRAIGVKDMGSIIPGHGGMLDRIDGILFVMPAVYYFYRFIGVL